MRGFTVIAPISPPFSPGPDPALPKPCLSPDQVRHKDGASTGQGERKSFLLGWSLLGRSLRSWSLRSRSLLGWGLLRAWPCFRRSSLRGFGVGRLGRSGVLQRLGGLGLARGLLNRALC